MTLEKAKKIIKSECYIADLLNLDRTRMVNTALDTVIEAAEETRWIPVTERLPDTDDEVLCWYEYYHWSRGKVLPEYGLGHYLGSTSTWCGEVANGKDVRVIAWMPLPQPYKAEGSDEE